MADRVACLTATGLCLVQRDQYPGGRCAYINGTVSLGAILEFLKND